MAELIKINDLRDGYTTLVRTVLNNGEEVAPRGIKTLEIQDAIIELQDPMDAIPLGVGRGINSAIGASETVQLIAGVSDLGMLNSASKGNFEQFARDGRLPGAYGPRIHDQLESVVRSLSADSDSRQAGVVIWRPDELQLADRIDSRDVPCTVSLFFRVREGNLNMSTFMRSNDVWWGTTYDFWMFTRLQITLAWALGLPVGTYSHHAASLHIYERDWNKIDQLVPSTSIPEIPGGIVPSNADTRPGERDAEAAVKRWRKARTDAVNIVLGRTDRVSTDNGLWYAEKLSTHISGGILCSKCRYVLPREHFKVRGDESVGVSRCNDCLDYEKSLREYVADVVDPNRRLAKRAASYGMDALEYEMMLDEQDYLCATCETAPDNGRYRDFVIDHDHSTGQVRGLLCNNCNQAIGLIKDSEVTAGNIALYLQRSHDDEVSSEL